MAAFNVYAGTLFVGSSNLEHGDPPMGVAFGEFMPAEGYVEIQAECRSNHDDQSALKLSIHSQDGTTIPCIGVSILDYSAEIEPAYIEVNLIGAPCEVYEKLFPNHITRYHQQFPPQPESGGERGT